MRTEFIPRPYQGMIIDHILDTPRCAVWAGMGTGKTVATLTAIDTLQMVEDGPVLVIAPLRVASDTWPNEVLKWNHLRGMNVSVITGTERERIAAIKAPAAVYATNYEQIVWLVEYWGDKWPYATVVLDESTKVKNFRLRQGGKRAQALGSIAHTKIKRLIELTGTPASNGLKDLWGQSWFIDAGTRLGRSYSAFSQRWFREGFDGFSLVPVPSAQTEIQDKLRDVCLTIEAKDWFDLHEPIVNDIMVDLPPKARKHYRDMEDQMYTELEGIEVEAFNAAAKTIKCLQLAAGAAYTDDTRTKWTETHKVKLEALESIVEEAAGMPVLVAYNFKSDLARLLKAFPQGRHLDKAPGTISDWNAGKIPVLFAHPACLHPWTEVLTEYRGWVKLIEVERAERVFDGVEFVSHSGCTYSGYEEVIDVFGITMTPGHKILVTGKWTEARHVGTCEDVREKARYAYEGDDALLGEMLAVRHGNGDARTKLSQAQPAGAGSLHQLCPRRVSPPDEHPDMAYLERDARALRGRVRQELRWPWDYCVRGVGQLFKFLRGHARGVRGYLDPRTGGREWAVLKSKLHVGNAIGATGQQAYEQVPDVPRGGDALGRIAPGIGRQQNEINGAPELGDDGGRSRSQREGLHLRDRTVSKKRSHVYDLVDCGPRHRFVIRNGDGDVFVSHNSAGHGLNLQHGGNILVFFSPNWNLEEHLQIIERIGPTRQMQSGYNRPVFIHRIIARDTVDELVLDRLTTKRRTQDILLDAMKKRRKSNAKG